MNDSEDLAKYSEKQYQKIFNNLQDAYYRTDAEGLITMASPSNARMMACEVDDLLGTPVAQYYVDAKQRDVFLKSIAEGGGVISNFEAELRRCDGEMIWVSTNAHQLLDDQGNVAGIEGTVRDITSRKQAEQQLLESEQSYRGILNSLREAVYIQDEQGRFLDVNEGVERMYGYPRDHFIGKTPEFLSAPERNDLDSIGKMVHLAFNGEPQSFEFWALRSSGEEFPKEVHLYPGSFFGEKVVVAVATDISRHKQIEKTLQQEINFRSQLLDQAAEGVVLWHLSHSETFVEFLVWNDRMQAITGYSRAEINKRGWLETMYADEFRRAEARNTMLAVLDGKVNKGKDFEIVTKAGEPRSLHIASSLVHSEDKEPCVLAVIQDVSERKKQQKLLETSRKRFQTLFDSTSDGLFILNMQGAFIDINRTAHERLGYTKEELLAMHISDLDSPEFAARVPQRIAEILANGHAVFESAHYRKDGSIMPVEINSRVIELDDEQVFFSVIRDISDRKMLEQQLRQSQKMEAIGTLVGGIAHDFNNMLAAIQGNIYLAKLEIQEHPEAFDRLSNIESLGTRAADMVQQLLTFARKDSVKMAAFNLNRFMTEGYKLAKAIIPENIDHQTRVCNESLNIIGDATQLQQVLFNLLNNAVDAVADTPHPRIRCDLAIYEANSAFKQQHAELQGDLFARITVQDNGCGMPNGQLEKIFEPFFTTKEVGKGTGLGLSMLYGAIQTHAGAIVVESDPGEGSSFHIYLPLYNGAIEAATTDQELPSENSGGTILLVDDEEELRGTTGNVLTKMGYQVFQAGDGVEALEIFRSKQKEISLILSDVVMPNMGGIELLKAIRQLDKRVPVILTTGYDKSLVTSNAIQMQNCQILNKPFKFDLLSNTIQQLIKKK